jgi:transposase
MSDAIDQVRRAEVHALRQQGRQPLLTKTRWLLLKRPEHQTREQRTRLRELVQHNLRAVRAMLLRESFDPFWTYRSVDWAGAFLDEWCVQVMRSRIEPMKKVVRMLRRHRPLLLNWFRARGDISAAVVEGFNTIRGASYRSRKRPIDSAEDLLFGRASPNLSSGVGNESVRGG